MVNVDQIIRYESGEMDEQEAVEMFAVMIADGTVWHLQGSYGRAAAALIEQGIVSSEGEILVVLLDEEE